MKARTLFPTVGRAAVMVVACLLLLKPAIAQNSATGDEIRFTAGVAGVFDDTRDGHLRVEYHFDRKLFFDIRPYLTAGYSADGSFHAGGGLELTHPISDNWRFTVASGPVFYDRNGGVDLGDQLEFISYAEIATEISQDVWIGANIAHISNASLGRINPGREMIGISLSFRPR